ncbi:hypothetical protein Rs2_02768 [Raphanus sativus]|nr:hypothetical protein Rs2_02768 [Raphanus sativus]
MTGQNRGGKKKTKQRKSTKRKSSPEEEYYLEDITGNDLDDQGNESVHPSAQENESGHPPAHEIHTDHHSATSQVITSVLVPSVDEELLLARILEGEPDYENEEGVRNAWSTWLTVKEKPIFWQGLYELDVVRGSFLRRKAKATKI